MFKKLPLLFFIFTNIIYAQNPKLSFTYDTSGNQTSRIYCATCSTIAGKSAIKYNDLKESDLNQFIPNDIISYYPNPVKDELFLKWKIINNNSVSEIQIYNLNGVLIKRIENLSEKETVVINFSDLKEGVYLLDLIYSDNNNETIKILKN